MVYALDSAAFTKKIRQRLGGDDKKVKALIEGLPSFSTPRKLGTLNPWRCYDSFFLIGWETPPPFPTWLTALWATV